MVDDPSESSWMQTTALNRGVGGVNADGWRPRGSKSIGCRGSRVGAMRSLNPLFLLLLLQFLPLSLSVIPQVRSIHVIHTTPHLYAMSSS
jgi:hypothetical protein